MTVEAKTMKRIAHVIYETTPEKIKEVRYPTWSVLYLSYLQHVK